MCMERIVRILPEHSALIHAAAEEFVERAGTAVKDRGRFSVALSGGSTPKALYSLLASGSCRAAVKWDSTHVFWGDERHVPPTHPASNYRMARESRREQKDASRKMQEAANGIRDSKLKEKIRYTKGLVDRGAPQVAEGFERDIQAQIESLEEKLGEAQGALGVSPEERRGAALDRARELARGLESMEERLRARGGERGERAGEGQAGREGRSEQLLRDRVIE